MGEGVGAGSFDNRGGDVVGKAIRSDPQARFLLSSVRPGQNSLTVW